MLQLAGLLYSKKLYLITTKDIPESEEITFLRIHSDLTYCKLLLLP